jgi:hypothetical protein
VRALGLAGVLLLSAALAMPAAAQKGHGGCPPGQAKKGNCEPSQGFAPPGKAKKWSMGQPLPPAVAYYPLPPSRYGSFGPPQPGYDYVQVDDDLLVMERATRIIVNVLLGGQ